MDTSRGLYARLHQKKASLFTTDKNPASAVKEYDVALKLLTPLHIEVDIQRVGSTVDMGDALYRSGKKSEAESQYLQALSYDWFKVREPEAHHRLKGLYLRAGRGLIEVRRNDLSALKGIIFWPATMNELGPMLQQAIRQAGGQVEDPPGEAAVTGNRN